MWADRAGELGWPRLFPAEGLAGGEREGKRELRFGKIEWDPLVRVRIWEEGFVCLFVGGERDWGEGRRGRGGGRRRRGGDRWACEFLHG